MFESDCQYLCHQCNCVTSRGKHLSGEVFRQYPYADIYGSRVDDHRDTPGTIILRGNPSAGQRYIVNLLGQYYPGTSRYANDTPQHREAWFQQCLHQLAQVIPAGASIGFPWRIGCGAAGGNWDHYLAMINQFAQKNPTYHVRIYQNE